MKIFVFHVSATNEWLQQKRILIIKWVGWHILRIAVRLFPQLPLSLSNEPVTMVIMAGVEVSMGSQHVLQLTKVDRPDYSHCWVPNLPAVEANTESPIWTLQGDQTAAWWQVDYIGPPLSWKRKCLILTRIDTLYMDLPSLHVVLLQKLSDVYLMVPCAQSWCSKHHYFWSRKQLQSRWIATMDPSSWNSLVLPWFSPSWSSWLDRMVECLLKTQLQYQLGGNIL